ncbi:hypothetical protein AB0C02_28725 [Micromonospora sp. NPDC048999]|uniref:hypothetical protein n=1 Tax=Micromonospora sp. NPDC048999 TaxID=3155391 RepID=UPI0033CB6D57
MPAQAAPQVDGYVWANSPSVASYVASGYERNSTDGTVQITRSSRGVYQVRFTGMAVSGGVAHARPYGVGNTGICTVSSWSPSGSDELVGVRCFDASGVPADSLFTASFTNRTTSTGSLAYLWANDPAARTPYVPSSAYSYDSTGGTSRIYKQSTGLYMMYLGAVDAHYPVTQDNGVYEITAYGINPVRCEVYGENDEWPTPIAVLCVDAKGTPVDARFSVTYAHGVSLLGTTGARANAYLRHGWPTPTTFWAAGYWGPGGAPTISRYGTGQYAVSFPGLSIGYGHATAGSRGDPLTYCHVAYWGSNYVRVACYHNVTNALIDSDFTVSLTV